MAEYTGNTEAKGFAAHISVVCEPDNDNNRSTVTVRLYIKRMSGGNRFEGWNIQQQITINGQVFNQVSQPNMNPGGTTELFSKQVVVPHESDGRKTVNISASINGNNQAFYVPGLSSINIQYKLPDIQRHTLARILGPTSITVGKSFNISMDSYNTSTYMYHLYYQKSDGSYILIDTDATHDKSITLGVEHIASAPNSGTLVLFTIPRSTGSEVGHTEIAASLVKPSGSYKPTINTISLSEKNSVVGTTLGSSYLQYISKVGVTVNATGSFGSTIDAIVIDFAGQVHNGNNAVFSNISAAGSVTLTITVRDSFGSTASKQQIVNILPYTYPSVSIRPNRPAGAPTNAVVTTSTSVASVNTGNTEHNGTTLTFSYREVSATSWTGEINVLNNDTNIRHTNKELAYIDAKNAKVVFDASTVYEIRAVIKDAFGGTAENIQTLGGEAVVMSRHHNGLGVGKTRTHHARNLDVASGGITTDGLFYRNGNTEIQNWKLSNSGGTVMYFKGNLNDVKGTGFFTIKTNECLNIPVKLGKYHENILTVMTISSFLVHQRLENLDGCTTYVRTLVNGNWTPWKIPNLDLIYPIGAILATSNTTNPTAYLGGTWSLIAPGRVLVGFDTTQTEFNAIGKLGGEKAHKLTIEEMPSHAHRQVVTANNGNSAIRRDHSSDGGSDPYDQGIDTYRTGGDQPHNNLQPYQVVAYWERRG